MILASLAAAALTIGATGLYLRSPNQPLIGGKPAGAPALLLGIAGLVASLLLLLSFMGPATAVFTWTTGLMFLWSVPPVAIGWLRHRREAAK